MRNLPVFISAFAIAGAVMISDLGHSDETSGEKATATMNKAKRKMHKTGHEAEEAVCAEGDAKCAAEKAKHRLQEGNEYMNDKAKETKDKVD